MSQLALARTEPDDATERRLLLIGNPNVGKSLIFTCLTNRYVTVSNYPGTTVELTSARAKFGDAVREVVDTPGTNGLIPQSEDERVARDMLLRCAGAGDVLQVGDMSNLRRTLLLSLQIAEHEVPFVLALNMTDEARDREIEVAPGAVAVLLGVPVVATSALKRWNIERLKREITRPELSTARVDYARPIEDALAAIAAVTASSRGVALSILAGDDTLLDDVTPSTLAVIDSIRCETQIRLQAPVSYAITSARLARVDEMIASLGTQQSVRASSAREWIGRISMHRVWGVPFLAAVLYLAWLFVGKFGAGTMVDFLEHTLFAKYVNPWTIRLVDVLAPFPHVHQVTAGTLTAAYTAGSVHGLGSFARFFHDLLVGPYGVVTMALTYSIAIVLPVVITFFFFFGLLEDSGYLPRLAVMLHRTFRRMGLNGKAVLPMVLGLGCDTMATLTTRILETKKEMVIVTLLLALGVPCSAQLGVIMAMLGPLGAVATFIWLGVTIGTIFLVGWLASKIVRGNASDFILEIPPIRTPKLSNIGIKVLARTEWYLKEAVPLFVVGTLLLYLLDFAHLLAYLQRALAPLIVGGLGLPAEASNAFVIGFLRRDYGAAGLFAMQQAGHLTPNQTVIALTVITLFIPCVANFIVMIKERGTRMGLAMAGVIIVYSFGIGWLMKLAFHALGVKL